MFNEGGLVETIQITSWVFAALLAIIMAVRHRASRNLAFACWLAFLAIACAFRELDTHIYLNPETLGSWGVRYRSDWWLSPQAPVMPRILWGTIGIATILAAILPLIIARPRFFVLLRARDHVMLCFAAGTALILFGYAADDLIGRGLIVSRDISKPIEESAELFGVFAILPGFALLIKSPLLARQDAARRRLTKPAEST